MKKYSFIFCCLWILSLASFAQNSENTFREAAITLLSGNNRQQDCDLLRQTAGQMQLPQLSTYAEALQQRSLDRGYQQRQAAAKALLDKAQSALAQPSEATIVCRKAYVDALTNAQHDECLTLVEQNEREANKLAEAQPGNHRLRDLAILTRLDKLQALVGDNFYDDPLQWESLYRIEKDVEKALQENNFEPLYRQWMLEAMGVLKFNSSQYPEYANYLCETLFQKGTFLPSVVYDDGLDTNAEAYFKANSELAESTFGSYDKRTLLAKTFFVKFLLYKGRITPDEAYWQLREILKKLGDMEHAEAPLSVAVRMMMFDCDVLGQTRLEETRQYAEMLLATERFFGKESQDYAVMLLNALSQRQMVDIGEAARLADQLIETARVAYQHQPVAMGFFFLQTTAVRQATMAPEDYASWVNLVANMYGRLHAVDWESVGWGHALAQFLLEMGANEKALEVFNIAFNDEQSILSNSSMAYAFELALRSRYLLAAGQGEEAERALEQATPLLMEADYKALFLYYLYEVQSTYGKNALAKETLRKAIDTCKTDKMAILKSYMQMVLGNMNFFEENAISDETEQLFRQAEPVFWDNEEGIEGAALDGYVKLGNYYQAKKDFARAEQILLKGKERYENLVGVFDNQYLSFINELFGLYAFEYNDLDRADQFLEERIAVAENNPLFSRHDLLFAMYWMRYQLIQAKAPNNYFLQLNSLQETFAKLAVIQQQTGGTLTPELKNQFMPFIYEMMRMSNYMLPDENEMENAVEEARQMGYKVAAEQLIQQREVLMQVFRQGLVPLLIEHEEKLRNEQLSNLANTDYLQVVSALSSYYLKVEKDTMQAIAWLDRLNEVDNYVFRYRYAYDKADLLYQCRRYAEAAQLYEQVEQMAQHSPQAMNSPMYKARFYNMLYAAYYFSGQYDKAIRPAREYRRYQKEYMEKNFDLLTETERAQMADMGAAGGDGLQLLVPKCESELAGEAYNSLLDEKGMLLRASDRTRQAIMGSGDRQLIASLDSLEQMRKAFQQMEQMNNWAQGDFNTNPAYLKAQQQMERLEREVNRGAAKYVVGERAMPSWQQVQRQLRQGDAAIEFIVSDTIMGALVLLPDGQQPHYVALTGIPSMLHALDEQQSKGGAHAFADALYDKDVLHLYQRLWQPMERSLQGVRRVFFSPIGFAHALAFAAFKCPDGQYLSDHYELHQLTTTAQLVYGQRKGRDDAMKAALCGAVFYSEEQQTLARQIEDGGSERGADDGRGAKTKATDAFGFLSFTKNEVEQIAEAAKLSGRVKALTAEGFEPTEQWLRSLSGDSPDILHLSTHGFFLSSDREVMDNRFLARFPALRFSPMMRSGLALVGANKAWEGTDLPENGDGILTAAEVASLDLSHTRLAVLSACQTGVGLSSKEGVYGMYRGFKQAGVGSIMASLWNVNDATTAALMTEFYRQWLSGVPMQQALHEAQRHLRQTHPSPFYWAPFFLLDSMD